MKFLHDTEQFQINAKNRETGEVSSLHCPMEGYLLDLFVRQNGLVPYIRSIAAFHAECEEKRRNVLGLRSKISLTHMENADAIKRAAHQIIGH